MSERDSWPDAPELAGPPGEEDEVEVEEAAEVELETTRRGGAGRRAGGR